MNSSVRYMAGTCISSFTAGSIGNCYFLCTTHKRLGFLLTMISNKCKVSIWWFGLNHNHYCTLCIYIDSTSFSRRGISGYIVTFTLSQGQRKWLMLGFYNLSKQCVDCMFCGDLCSRKLLWGAFLLDLSVLGADDNEHEEHRAGNFDEDNDYDDDDNNGDDNDDDDDNSDLKSVKLLTPQHCCEDISRSQETLTSIINHRHHHYHRCCHCHCHPHHGDH